jgi:hypothetical protein
MFFSEKDFKKSKQKTPSKSSSSISSTQQPSTLIDVVEKAKVERDNRRHQREIKEHVIKVQKWWRGASVRKNVITKTKSELDRKLLDIENVRNILRSKGNIEFCPPPNIVFDMMKSIVFLGIRNLDDVDRLIKYANLVLNPVLRQPEEDKNIIIQLSIKQKYDQMSSAFKIINLVMISLTPQYTKKIDTLLFDSLLSCIYLIFNGPSILKMQPTSNMKLALESIRRDSIRRNLFHDVRRLITLYSAHLMTATIEEDSYSSSMVRPLFDGKTSLHGNMIVSKLVDICMKFFTFDIKSSMLDILSRFTMEILSIPLLTCLLVTESLYSLANWKYISQILDHLNNKLVNDALAIPSSAHEILQGGELLLGNIASLGPYLRILPPTSTTQGAVEYIDDITLNSYLRLCSQLIQKFWIPGVLQGRSGVIWSREGNNLTAAAIPSALQSQLLSLLQSQFIISLYKRILNPVGGDLVCLGNNIPEDITDINQSLKSTSLKLVQEAAQEMEEASAWFSSKWAIKLLSSVGKTMQRVSSITSSNNTVSSSTLLDGNIYKPLPNDTDTAEVISNEFSPTFEMNIDLISALSELWAILLSHAVIAPIHTIPGKALTTLVFSTATLDRIWLALLSTSLGAQNHFSIFNQSKQQQQQQSNNFSLMNMLSWKSSVPSTSDNLPSTTRNTMSSNTGSHLNSKENIQDNQRALEAYGSTFELSTKGYPDGIYGLLTVSACLLRSHLVALDDSEMYKRDVSIY